MRVLVIGHRWDSIRLVFEDNRHLAAVMDALDKSSVVSTEYIGGESNHFSEETVPQWTVENHTVHTKKHRESLKAQEKAAHEADEAGEAAVESKED